MSVLLAVLLAGLGLVACAAPTGVEVRSVQQGTLDAPDITLAAYTAADRNTAEVYLTDLAPDAFRSGADITSATGRIVQLRMFLEPRAGRTPIEPTACSVIVRHIVLANGEVGIYSGGGFMNPPRSAGGARFAGTVRGATLRLTARTPGFNDALGASTFQASFTAQRNDELADQLAARVDELLHLAPLHQAVQDGD